MPAARPVPWSQEQLAAAMNDAWAAHADLLSPFGQPSPLTASERAVLQRGGADLTDRGPASGDALLRSTAEYAAILATSLTTTEAARRLGVSEIRVRQRLAGRSLLGVLTPRGWRIPGFQFTADGELPGWDRVARAIPEGVSPVEVFTWLELPHPDLRVRGRAVAPRAWLASGGDPAAVVAATDDFVNR